MEVKTQLEEQLSNDFEKLKDLSDEEKAKEIRNIDILYKLHIEEKKMEKDAEQKAQQLKQTENSEMLKTGVKIFEVAAPLVSYGIFYKMGLKFESEGAFTSMTVKGLLNKVKFFK